MVEESSEDRKQKEEEHGGRTHRDTAHAKPTSKKELIARLEEVEREASENYERYLRAAAELEN